MNRLHLTPIPPQTDLATFVQGAENEPSLALQEEQDLGWAVVNEGCPEAFQRLYTANRRLVLANARRFRDRGLDWWQLLEHGREGLCNAVEQFDPGQGVRFSTHASWWIKSAIRRALSQAQELAIASLAFREQQPRRDTPGAA